MVGGTGMLFFSHLLIMPKMINVSNAVAVATTNTDYRHIHKDLTVNSCHAMYIDRETIADNISYISIEASTRGNRFF